MEIKQVQDDLDDLSSPMNKEKGTNQADQTKVPVPPIDNGMKKA